jgi:hypothetical protein
MYRSEEWRARLWHLGPNEELLPPDAQPSLTQHRAQRLKFCQDGIGLSAQWESRLKMITARVEGLYQRWAALVEKMGPLWEEDLDGCRAIARHVLGEQRWLRDQDGIAGVTMKVLAKHRGVDGLDCVIDGPGGLVAKGQSVKFSWISFR